MVEAVVCVCKDEPRARIQSELEMWMGVRGDVDDIIEMLKICDRDVFPNVHRTLKTLVTLGVGVASVERSFSSLRRIKTWLRSTMVEERLSSLAIMAVNRHVKPDLSRVVDLFAQSKTRKLDLLL